MTLTAAESLVGSDHVSEGLILRFSSKWVRLFRLDPGVPGDHTGNAAYIAKQESTDHGESWGSVSTVYSDEYDDRNLAGGVLDSNRGVVFFRRYNKGGSPTSVDISMIYTDDEGTTWSSRATIDNGPRDMMVCFGDVFTVPTKGYAIGAYESANWSTELWFSTDGVTWPTETRSLVIDGGTYSALRLGEMGFGYLGDGKIVCISGQSIVSANPYAGRFHYTTSDDYGDTWAAPTTATIEDYYGNGTAVVVDGEFLYHFWHDRRGTNYADNANSRVWATRSTLAEAYTGEFPTLLSCVRPAPSSLSLYGYPKVAKRPDGTYYVMFTERWTDADATEGAGLYDFVAVPFDYDIYLGAAGSRRRFALLDPFAPTRL